MLSRTPIGQALPGLLLLGLLQATQPALARGLVPVCTATGTDWIDPAGSSDRPQRDPGSVCLHGWCASRRTRTG